ncbi:MAG: alpha/beta fold hydrolase [Nitrososphaeraceae archaeon]|nr:alpha/beta fold hydrolase [Nitrososphaeraceae archaeon]
MFLFCKSCLIIVILLNLIFILNSVTVAQNIVRAQATENGTYPYQAPLFASLDDREDTNTEERRIETETIRQNSTLSYNSTAPPSYSTDNQSSTGELLLSANNPLKVADSYRDQDSRVYDVSNTSGSFYLGDVQFNHYRINVNGISMHYVKGGEGDPIVLLHGWPKTWYEWRYIMPILVNNNYTVIVPDLRGLGDTSKPSAGYDGNTGPMTPPNKRVQTINAPGSEVGPGAVLTWGKALADQAEAMGFKWDWKGRSSKHIPFDWSGP